MRMTPMKTMYLEKIYAGWLAKIIGIRMGAPVEGWTYDAIQHVYGNLDGYPFHYEKQFAADDDSNGPIFLIRALEDHKGEFTAQSVGEALLNYASFERGFFWWAGYGTSTEHTAYLNLRHGIEAPRSGSIEQNGRVVAEQIGGQIFIDTWGLVTPGNPARAAEYAAKAASVTHGGNGIYGGIFIAACISCAFEEQDILRIIETGLSFIPSDCEYSQMARCVIAFHNEHPSKWLACFHYVQANFGYDRYGGFCHIIPNAALIILALLYGEGHLKKSLDICNTCGWDTDCNLGNLATILGVRGGLAEVDASGLRGEIGDFYVCSGVLGSLNILDIPYSALYLAKLAWAVAGKQLPPFWDDIAQHRIDSCHFEFPGSTHGMRARGECADLEVILRNTDESAATGSRSLNASFRSVSPGARMFLYKKTYYKPDDFHNSRYDPSFSPLVYPGQTLHGSIFIPNYSFPCKVRLYAHDAMRDVLVEGDSVIPEIGAWQTLSFKIPRMEGALLDEIGFIIDVCGHFRDPQTLTVMVDDLYADGAANYLLDCAALEEERWTEKRVELQQFTRLKGLLYLDQGQVHLSCTDFGEAYTGRHDWTDYAAEFTLRPIIGQNHMVNVRVQGAIRSYAVALKAGQKLALLKNENGYRVLAETPFAWHANETYRLHVCAKGSTITISANNEELLVFTDADSPYLSGAIGISVLDGSHCAYTSISVS